MPGVMGFDQFSLSHGRMHIGFPANYPVH